MAVWPLGCRLEPPHHTTHHTTPPHPTTPVDPLQLVAPPPGVDQRAGGREHQVGVAGEGGQVQGVHLGYRWRGSEEEREGEERRREGR